MQTRQVWGETTRGLSSDTTGLCQPDFCFHPTSCWSPQASCSAVIMANSIQSTTCFNHPTSNRPTWSMLYQRLRQVHLPLYSNPDTPRLQPPGSPSFFWARGPLALLLFERSRPAIGQWKKDELIKCSFYQRYQTKS